MNIQSIPKNVLAATHTVAAKHKLGATVDRRVVMSKILGRVTETGGKIVEAAHELSESTALKNMLGEKARKWDRLYYSYQLLEAIGVGRDGDE